MIDAGCRRARGGEMLLYVPADVMEKVSPPPYMPDPEFGLDATQAIDYGLARVIEEEDESDDNPV